MTAIRTFRQYLAEAGTAHYADHYFCGECGLLIDKPYGYARTPDDLDDCGSFPLLAGEHDEFRHYSFCPWCGVVLDDEWWQDSMVENERLVDHFDYPGTHAGDTHEFPGFHPAGHHVGGDPDVCWCEPFVEPGPLGCRIVHNDRAHS